MVERLRLLASSRAGKLVEARMVGYLRQALVMEMTVAVVWKVPGAVESAQQLRSQF